MYATLQSRYQRVEKALDNLLDSVTAYNPSTSAADELVAADKETNQALEQLSIHHANYTHLLSLRATSSALDTQIQSTLRSLSSLRSSLQTISLPTSTSTTTAPASVATHPVRVDALLSYAKFISKTSVPPTRRPAKRIKTEPTSPAGNDSGASSAQETPAAPATGEEVIVETNQRSDAMDKVLPPEVAGQFIPWPGHEVVRAGGLAVVQGMREAGRDPGSVTEEESNVKAEAKAEDEEQVPATAAAAVAPVQIASAPVVQRPREEDVFDPDEM